MTVFTVIGLYDDTGQVFADSVRAADPHEAMAIVARRRNDDAQIIAAVKGKHMVVPPCEDSGKSAWCCDLVDADAEAKGGQV